MTEETRWVVKLASTSRLYWGGENRWVEGIISARWFESYGDAERAVQRDLGPQKRAEVQIVREAIQ